MVSVTQIGYGIGLFLLVPLADLLENRRLVLTLLGLTVAGLAGLALSPGAASFFVAALLVGLCATGAQVLLPFVAQMVPEERRGRVVGNIMAGILTGIMLARPVSLFVSSWLGWRAVFWGSAVLLVAMGAVLARAMPRHRPSEGPGGGLRYGGIVASMMGLFRAMPAVRWRSVYAAAMFGAFNMFWTAAPLMLADRFGLDGHGIGLFALAGAGGALAAPIAGRLSERNVEGPVTAGCFLLAGLGFLGTLWAAQAGALVAMAVLAVVIDAAVQANQVVSRRTIFAVPPAVRGRVNAIYMTLQFAGGAAGSVLGTVTYGAGGWTATALAGVAIALLSLGLLALERRGLDRRGPGAP